MSANPSTPQPDDRDGLGFFRGISIALPVSVLLWLALVGILICALRGL